MQTVGTEDKSNLVYYRLIALWVVCEAVLGGIIHGLKLPVSGLIVGSSAVVCISLIGWYKPGSSFILKATLVVALFKMMLSPHSPLPAYVAVFFQGLLGQVLFLRRKYFKPACIVFGSLALLESGVQRILVMTFLYGKDLWEAVNVFISGFTKEWSNYSELLIGTYLFFHLVAGLLAGYFAARLPAQINSWEKDRYERITIPVTPVVPTRSKKKKHISLWIAWCVLLFLLVQGELHWGRPLLPSSLAIQILVRSVVLILGWIFFLQPLFLFLLKNWLQKKAGVVSREMKAVLQLLPSTKYIVNESWALSATERGYKRLQRFFRIVLFNTFYHA